MNAKYKRNQVHKQESIILPGILLPGDLDSGQARSRYLITSTRLLVQNSYQETKMIIKVWLRVHDCVAACKKSSDSWDLHFIWASSGTHGI